MVKLTIETRDGRSVVIEFGHGRKAISLAEAEADRLRTQNRWAKTVTVTGKLDF